MSKSSTLKLLRGSFSTSPGPSSQPTGSFVLPCRKLIINYSESKPSSAGVRTLLRINNRRQSNNNSNSISNSNTSYNPNSSTIENEIEPALYSFLSSSNPNQKSDPKLNSNHNILDVAHRFPQTEIIIQQNENREPCVSAFYINSRSKVIPLSNLPSPSILQKIQLALDSSGRKLEVLHRRRPVESINVGARGVWSPVHGPRGRRL